jgi:hypothetical protein
LEISTRPQSDTFKYNHPEHCGYVTATAHVNTRNPTLNAMETVSPAMSEMQMSDVSSTDYISMSEKLDIALPSSSYENIGADMTGFPLDEAMDPQSITSLSDLGQDGQDILNMAATGDHPLLRMCPESDFASVSVSPAIHSENSNDAQSSTFGIMTPDTHSVYANSEPDPDDSKEPLNYELQQAFRILREIMTESNKSINWPFMNVIDASQEGCEHYYQFVKQPMWLKKSELVYSFIIYVLCFSKKSCT